jgi:glycosyltransferase involved in cell wall biosynthesis
MKVALVHDYIKEYGGAERVLEALHEIWPDAPVYTSVYLPEFLGPHKERFKDYKIKTSWLQNLPFKAKLISPIRLLTPWIFKQFDFSDFDVVIVSSTGAYVKQFKVQSSKFKVIVYCHTPPRYLYGYATAREWKKNMLFRILGETANHFLRLIDFKEAQNVDHFIANSQNVAKRIEKFYRRESTVIYPPVSASSELASSVQLKNKKLDANLLNARRYFLAGGRIAKPKHIDLIVETFEKLGLSLKVFGRTFANQASNFDLPAGEARLQTSSIDFVGEVSDEQKIELMRNAKAYIFAAEDEDFGITPVEAMSVGTPVIAYKSGGVLETVLEEKTGLFFDVLKPGSLTLALNKFNILKFDKKFIIKHAEKFSKERFKKEIESFVNKSLTKNQ